MSDATPMRYTPLSLADLEALELPERQDIVADGLLVAGSLTLFSAREKSGKTMLSTDLMCAIASEEPFIDRAVSPSPVVFIALEENIREVRDRAFMRLGRRRDVPVSILPANGFDETVFWIDNPACMDALARMIREFSAGVVIVDTLREAHRLRENESDDMGPLFRPLRQIAHQENCAIILLHHQNKLGGARGSTAIGAGVDLLWTFHRTDAEHDAGPPVGRLTVEGRFGPKQVLGIRLGDGLRWVADNAAMTTDQTVRGRLLDELRKAPAGLTAHQLADATGGAVKTVQNEISQLLKASPAPIVATGAGTKGSPRRYLSVTPELFPDDSGSDGNHDITMIPPGSRVGEKFGGNHFGPAGEAGADRWTT